MSDFEEDIIDTFNAFEAAITNLKQRRAKKHGVVKGNTENAQYNPENIGWVKTEGPNGIYERYPAQGQTPEQKPDYQWLLADLNAHEGKLQRTGLFYWKFNDNFTIGRKPSRR